MARPQHLTVSIAGTDLVLDPDRALYWPERETLLLSDLHLGKMRYLHKEGIATPGPVINDDYERLYRLMQRYRVKHWICLGDLFHSHWKQEHPLFLGWREAHPDVKLTLLEGNHDRYMRKHYKKLDMDVLQSLDLNPFYLIHDWKHQTIPDKRYALSGHLHPCVRLFGKGKQMIKLVCFWFQTPGAYLPAFGQFTGSHAVLPKENDQIYVVANAKVVEANLSDFKKKPSSIKEGVLV